MEDRALPGRLAAARRTPTFTADTVPTGLLREHHTTVWARLEVEAGSVVFYEDQTGWTTTATRDEPVVIVPNRIHRIEPSDDARFAIQFFEPSA